MQTKPYNIKKFSVLLTGGNMELKPNACPKQF
jgi:hypothetical protein